MEAEGGWRQAGEDSQVIKAVPQATFFLAFSLYGLGARPAASASRTPATLPLCAAVSNELPAAAIISRALNFGTLFCLGDSSGSGRRSQVSASRTSMGVKESVVQKSGT